MYGRHGESPLPIVAPATPAGCFDAAIEAVRIAVKYRTPVILLSDTFLANSSEPWLVPSAADIAPIDPGFATGPNAGDEFLPYSRDENGARPWAVPGTPGTVHRIGGLEKEHGSGNISYDSDNHALMTHLRAGKVAGVARDVPDVVVDSRGAEKLLVLGWGSSYGAIAAAARLVRMEGGAVATAHVTHLNPLPSNLGDVLRSYERVLIPEMNSGQFARIVRAEFLVDAEAWTKVDGLPIATGELTAAIKERM
jgi:2-oxoglutarate ferredoxin oxidoreductase subunit alpha